VGNAAAAVSISGNGSSWGAWTTYTSGAYSGRASHTGAARTRVIWRLTGAALLRKRRPERNTAERAEAPAGNYPRGLSVFATGMARLGVARPPAATFPKGSGGWPLARVTVAVWVWP